jgi:hypothetical protein
MRIRSIRLLLSGILTSLFVFGGTVNASPPPEAVEKAKTESLLHVIGIVRQDKFVSDTSTEHFHPLQIRTMQLEIVSVSKKPPEMNLAAGDRLDVTYHYYPSWLKVVGPARMDIMVGDRIEIWLKKGEDGWNPAMGGSTVEHLERVEPRREPIPLPLFQRIGGALELFGAPHFWLILFVTFSLIAIGIWDVRRHKRHAL